MVATGRLDGLAEECTDSMCDWAICNAEHDALDPEYSILKQRLARRIRHDGLTDVDIAKMDLVGITKVGDPAPIILKYFFMLICTAYAFWLQCGREGRQACICQGGFQHCGTAHVHRGTSA